MYKIVDLVSSSTSYAAFKADGIVVSKIAK